MQGVKVSAVIAAATDRLIPMPRGGRRLECRSCGASYRAAYRGRYALCRSCQVARDQDESELQQTSSQSITSLSNLPVDVLCSLVPYCLASRMQFDVFNSELRDFYCEEYCWEYCWARSAVDDHFDLSRFSRLQHVVEHAWLPTLRIKLVCKALNAAVSMRMTSLTQPRDACNMAATTIQVAFSRCRSSRPAVPWFLDMDYQYADEDYDWAAQDDRWDYGQSFDD